MDLKENENKIKVETSARALNDSSSEGSTCFSSKRQGIHMDLTITSKFLELKLSMQKKLCNNSKEILAL